jgi:hypothetical protein
MNNKHALYVLPAALALAALTNRWLLDAPEPAFNADKLDSTFFDAQWIAFLMTAGAVVVLAANWHKSRQFPRAIFLGVAMLLYFLATGIPFARNAAEWARGNAGIAAWTGDSEISGIAREVESRLAGAWQAGPRIYTIGRNALTIEASGTVETFSPFVCREGAYFRFGNATEDVFHGNPAAEPYYQLLARPPVPMFEAACKGSLYTFVLRADGKLVAFKDLQGRNPRIEILTRVP